VVLVDKTGRMQVIIAVVVCEAILECLVEICELDQLKDIQF
jgi:hypothetical protein